MEEDIVTDAKIGKVKNVQVLYTKSISAAAYMIQLTFVYFLCSLYIVYMYKKHTKTISVSQLYRFCIVGTLFVCTKNIQRLFQQGRCIGFVQFVHYFYIQKTYKGCFSQLVVQVLYSLYFVCTKNIHFKFQVIFSLSFVQVLYSLYIFVHSLSYKILICTIFICKIYTKLVFCINNVYILYSFCTIFLVRIASVFVLICIHICSAG